MNEIKLSAVCQELSDSDTECSDTEDDTHVDHNPSANQLSNMDRHTLYHTGMLLRNAIADGEIFEPTWPPLASDYSPDIYEHTVPDQLYNILAIATGLTDEVPDDRKKIEIKQVLKTKLMSLCHDLIYLRNGGKTQTCKSLMFGLTVKHLTASSHVVKLLHRFGHCASYDTITRYETALASKAMQTIGDIPPGFSQSTPTVLVYDNIDYSEETLSGHGTTHHTNGIMVQVSKQESPPASTSVNVSTGTVSKAERTLHPATQSLEMYILGTKQCCINANVLPTYNDCAEAVHQAACKDFAYFALKSYYEGSPLPSWTVYNQSQQSSCLPKSNIHYLPVIEAPATDISTVNHILMESMKTVDKLKLDSICVVFDQALYAKAQQVRWKNPMMTRKLILRMGEFHTCMCFLSAIGKICKGSGLEDILIESETIASGSMNGVLSGRMYNRAIRAHKLVLEALSRLQIQHFLDSLPEADVDEINNALRAQISNFTNSRSVESDSLNDIYERFQSFTADESSANPTYSFWNIYMGLIETILLFIRATRESDWELHMNSLRLMLPIFFICDKVNYARYVGYIVIMLWSVVFMFVVIFLIAA